ncbi:MAG TPA: UDP-glucose/GDP-mannose dehydrogenase family protein [Candidatus Binatia bacterium]|nr:UDP-glucose/GDP-mannose dehydrogenase family protein [Candidatus Binatia bacterium]
MARVSIFGLGYVGAVSVAVLADNGHKVIGVDVNPAKVAMINRGQSPIVEAGLSELMGRGVAAGCIQATSDAACAIQESDISLICVGTPSKLNGSLDLSYIERVSQQIGESLAHKDGYHVIIARSTMLPGSTEEVVIPALEEASGKRAGQDFGVCFNPEFLREGSSIKDFYDPPYTIIGSEDERVVAAARELYGMIEAPLIVAPVKVAEMVKYVSNAFHALKVTFANEIGNICREQEIDSHRVMDVFCQDTKLNISPAYLKPGFAFGGSCLPKDLRALLYHVRHLDQDAPVLQAIIPSNQRQVDRAYQMVRRTGSKRVGILGFSFKAGTDDLRESPVVELVERLIGKGYQVTVYDSNVSMANLQGANRAYIEREIPHIASLMCESIDGVLAQSEVVIIGNGAETFRQALKQVRPEQTVIDLVRITQDGTAGNGHYQGICW